MGLAPAGCETDATSKGWKSIVVFSNSSAWITRRLQLSSPEKALKSLRSALAAGKLTDAIRKQGDRKLVEGFLPSETPAGIVVDNGTRNRYLDSVNINELPSLAIEFLIAEKSWANEGRTDWNLW